MTEDIVDTHGHQVLAHRRVLTAQVGNLGGTQEIVILKVRYTFWALKVLMMGVNINL